MSIFSVTNFQLHFDWQAEEVQEVNRANGFTAGDDEFMAKLCEEVDELQAALSGYQGGKLPGFGNVAEEMADIVIVLMFYAAEHGVPLSAAIEAKCEYNRSRGFRHGKES